MRFNIRLIAHLLFSGAFMWTTGPAVAMQKDGKTIVVTLCSQPGMATQVEIPIDGKQVPQPDGMSKGCHAVCCSRRGAGGDGDDDNSGE